MQGKVVQISSNASFETRKTVYNLTEVLQSRGFTVVREFSNEVSLIICVGGDGSFIKAVHKTRFPDVPFVGVNTGHLGFFQEVSPDELESFVDSYLAGNYQIEDIMLVGAEVFTRSRSYYLTAINEIVLKAQHSRPIHMNVFVNRNHVERFSGDGMIVSTPSGSTAYNHSCGGSIVHFGVEALQITPIAPMNSSVYRCLTNPVLVPSSYVISLVPERRYANSNLILLDGQELSYRDLKRINLRVSNKTIKRLILSKDYYWGNLKDKFL